MRLGLPFRSESASTSRARAAPAPYEQSSLAVKPLLESLRRSGRPCVLDLGVATAANLDFFARMGSRLTVADLYRGLMPLRGELERAGHRGRVFDSLVPGDPASPFDVVLAWDILNYLKPEEIASLTESLGHFCKPGALLFAIIASSGDIPLTPAHYSVLDEETLVIDAPAPRNRPAPRHSEQMLLRLMPGMTVENRFQLRNETVEYLFSYRGSPGLGRGV